MTGTHCITPLLVGYFHMLFYVCIGTMWRLSMGGGLIATSYNVRTGVITQGAVLRFIFIFFVPFVWVAMKSDLLFLGIR